MEKNPNQLRRELKIKIAEIDLAIERGDHEAVLKLVSERNIISANIVKAENPCYLERSAIKSRTVPKSSKKVN